MGLESESWSSSRRGMAVIVGLVAGVFVAAALVLTAAPGAPDVGPPDPVTPIGESPGATISPDSKPSSGPTETPEPGSLEPVQVEEVSFAPPIGLDGTGDFGTGLTIRIEEIEAVDGVARGPGQVSGPALRLTVEARNGSGEAVSLEGMVVDLTYGADGTPAMPLSEPGGEPFEGELAGRDQAVAAYVFAVPEQARDRITVTASYTGSAPTVVFEGTADGAPR